MSESPLQMTVRLRAKIERRENYARKWSDAYEGKRPLLFASPEFNAQAGGLFKDFSDNWCATVPDATVERLMPIAFRLEDGTVDKAAGKAWRKSECDVISGAGTCRGANAARDGRPVPRDRRARGARGDRHARGGHHVRAGRKECRRCRSR
jgi:hypothetical protein